MTPFEPGIDALVAEFEAAPTVNQRLTALTRLKYGQGFYTPNLVAILEDVKETKLVDVIFALGNSSDPRAEAHLLRLGAATASQYTLTDLNAALGSCGSAASLPHLVRMLDSKRSDVRCSAIAAISRIGGRAAEGVMIAACDGSKSDMKGYACTMISVNGSPACLPSMRIRLVSMLKNPHKIASVPDDLWTAFYFFVRLQRDSVDAARAVSQYSQAVLDRLDSPDRETMQALLAGEALAETHRNFLEHWVARTPWY